MARDPIEIFGIQFYKLKTLGPSETVLCTKPGMNKIGWRSCGVEVYHSEDPVVPISIVVAHCLMEEFV